VLLNVVDVAPSCDWIAPAVVRRGPLQVAISTSGESPFLAAALRTRLEALLGEEWGQLTSLTGWLRRRLRHRGVDADVQQRIYRRLLRSPALTLLRGHDDAAARALAVAIAQSAQDANGADAPGEVVLVGAGPGDPGLLTVAARELLLDADVVFHDALVDPSILRLCGHARLVDAGKRAGRRSVSQAEINTAMIDAARAGDLVVRLKGGDPFVFGRGGEEVEALVRAGVTVRVIPGVSAALAAPAAAGIPVTHRGIAGSVAITTGHRAAGQDSDITRLAAAVDTLVVLMPVDLDGLAARLAAVLGPERPAAMIMAATTPSQRVIRAPLGTIAAAARVGGIAPPATLVVGQVVTAITASVEAHPERRSA
jgi:uroporphyrin-III C-methyltransferase/precorrin-2 dehydrogenase/sirohydrochlorin ferrochelatase